MRFEQCYVQPLCTPTRVQLMTGLYNVRNYFSFGQIDRDAKTFAHFLKDAGYATGMAGKWQLGRGKNLPRRLGFDEFVLWQHTRRPPRYANPGLEYNGEERDFNSGEYGPDLINDFVLEFISRHREGPFFLYYSMMLTHAPFQPTPDSADWNPHARGEKDRDAKYFSDMVTYADKHVGSIEAKLEELGIRQDTLVIFLGDNGTGAGITSRFEGREIRGGKGQASQRGMRVPLIVNWPGQVAAGTVNDDLVASTDFLPTICEAAGVKLPATMPADGQSFYEQLLGRTGTPRETLYCWYARGDALRNVREFAMTKQYKLYRNGRFFDVVADPDETEPRRIAELGGDAAEAASKLQSVLEQYANARPASVAAAAAAASQDSDSGDRRRSRRRERRRATADQIDAT
jgi:arylsulfatase A